MNAAAAPELLHCPKREGVTKRRIKITIRTVRRQTIKSYVSATQAQCPICGREAEMITEAEAMQILGVSDEVLHARIAAGQIHAVPTANGASGICKNSL